MKTGKPERVPGKSRFLRRRRVVNAERGVENGLKDTERRGVPNDLPSSRKNSRRRV